MATEFLQPEIAIRREYFQRASPLLARVLLAWNSPTCSRRLVRESHSLCRVNKFFLAKTPKWLQCWKRISWREVFVCSKVRVQQPLSRQKMAYEWSVMTEESLKPLMLFWQLVLFQIQRTSDWKTLALTPMVGTSSLIAIVRAVSTTFTQLVTSVENCRCHLLRQCRVVRSPNKLWVGQRVRTVTSITTKPHLQFSLNQKLPMWAWQKLKRSHRVARFA